MTKKELRDTAVGKLIQAQEKEIKHLSELLNSERQAWQQRMAEQTRSHQRVKSKLDWEITRLGARIAAMENALVLAHQRSYHQELVNRELEANSNSFGVAPGDSLALAGAVEEPVEARGLRYKRVGDRWELEKKSEKG